MANTKNNVQPQVVTTTTTTTSRRGRRRRRRANRPSQPTTTTVRKVTTARQATRPRRGRRNRSGAPGKSTPSSIRQRITATLGTVGSNQGNEIEMEMACLLNPALMKETTGSNQHGPLQIYASTYSLWRIERIILKLTPLVGPSAVSGTAVRASYNPSGQPGSPSWSALGARRHRDTNPGRPLYFVLSGKEFKGPKDGWFFCNTKNDPQMCTAGSIEIHTLGQTISTYQNKQFDGPLFLAEMTCDWSFKGYNPMPGMLTLVKAELKEKEQAVKIYSKPGEPITISVPPSSLLARTTGGPNAAADATPSEIIWSICDTTMDVVTGALPAPFEWLFRAGWWFVKRIANRKTAVDSTPGEPNAGEVTFQVFQSLSDARNDVPCIATSTAQSTNTEITGWHIVQVTPGNVGSPQATMMMSRSADFTLDDIKITSEPLLGQSAFYGHIFTQVPNSCFVAQRAVGTPQSKVYSYIAWHLNKPVFMQNGNEINPAQLSSNPYPLLHKEGGSFREIGTVFAAGYAAIGQTPDYNWTTVLWRSNITEEVKIRGQTGTTDRFVFIQPTQSSNTSSPPTTVYNVTLTNQMSMPERRIPLVAGEWYLSSFVTYHGAIEFTNYGIPFYHGLQNPTTTSSQYDIGRPVFDVGAAMQTSMPLTLTPPSASSVPSLTNLEVEQLRSLLNPGDLPPPLQPGYDSLEMPPLEEEEEELQGAVGDTGKRRDTRNWVEFGHRKRPPTPFSPIEEEEEDEEESDLDDDDYAEVPSFVKNLLTPEAKKLLDDLKKMGLSHEKAVKAAQGAYPHPAVEKWETAYHNALVDGLSPPSARDCAWGEISDYL
nr:capsid protein [Porcine astrovirus 4]